jgi:chromate reductase, NAD(P)H dehydrogenase (quinone)
VAQTVRILGISGSLRRKSFNSALLRACYTLLPDDDTSLTIADIQALPIYNGDIDGENTPDVVTQFKAQIREADALLLAYPEYNHSVSGAIKNAIDWASRRTPGADASVISGKPAGLMSVATGMFGGVRAREHMLQIAIAVNMTLVTRPAVLVPKAREKFDDDLNLTDGATRQFVGDLLQNLVDFTRKQTS